MRVSPRATSKRRPQSRRWLLLLCIAILHSENGGECDAVNVWSRSGLGLAVGSHSSSSHDVAGALSAGVGATTSAPAGVCQDGDANACSGHGHCSNGTCVCHVKYEGETCSTPTCLNACSNQGECFNGTCYCFDNFAGEDCSSVACDSDCHGNGRCNNGTCVCNTGWVGDSCALPRCPNNCSLHGSCNSNGTCDCDPFFSGDDCSNTSCPIVDGKVCSGTSRGYCSNDTCICRDGFGGRDCSQTVCPNNCSGHGSCSNFTCTCQAAWRGIDCAIPACDPGCEDHGYCHDGQCHCDPGWANELVPVLTQPDANASNGTTTATTTLAPTPDSGSAMRLSNDCHKMVCPADCSGHGTCSNFTCKCTAPWLGPKCDTLPCPHNCSGLGSCNNGTCVCDEGVWGPACQNIECPVRPASEGPTSSAVGLARGARDAPGAQPRCSGHGACSPTGECICSPGFTGEACQQKSCPNDCHGRGKCRADGTCECGRHFGAADCSFAKCVKGISDEALAAQEAGLAAASPTCGGHGECMNGTCFCAPGWTGDQCSVVSCADSCNFHGRCGRDGKCSCDRGWTGSTCAQRYVVPHHGMLMAGNAEPPVCFQGWSGPDCGTAQCPNNCSNSARTTAQNSHGECRDGRCQCSPSWTGDDCSQPACPYMCRGHGTCGRDGRCRCDEGFTGDSCSVRYVEHGHCNAADGTCFCGPVSTRPNFPGQRWEGAACNRRGCLNNCSAHLGQGQCRGDRTNATCLCKVGFTGEDCSKSACPAGCSGHGVCEQKDDGAAACRCDRGFGGPSGDCSQRICVDGCGESLGRGKCDEALGICTCQFVGAASGIPPPLVLPNADPANNTTATDTRSRAASATAAAAVTARLAALASFPGQKWSGIDCGSKSCINDCSGDGGLCVNGTCYCRDGRGGEDCSVPVCPRACSFHGRCVAGGLCRCDDGWTGPTCLQPQCPGTITVNGFASNPKVDVPCSGHGECSGAAEGTPSYSCDCEPGWTGLNCSRRQCIRVQERHLRSARIVSDGITRSVRQGVLDGAESSEGSGRNLWSAYVGKSGCGEHGYCVNGTCFCDQGWAGFDCDVQSCPNSCSGRGVCRSNGTCLCPTGWGGAACEQRVCKGPNGNCSGHGVCVPGYDDFHLLVRTPPAVPASRRIVKRSEATGSLVANATAKELAAFGGTRSSTQSHTAVTVHRPGPRCKCAAGWGGDGCGVKLCPRNCSGHGICANGTCVCGPMRQGVACEVPVAGKVVEDTLQSLAFLTERWCPDDCSGHGRCAITGVFVDVGGNQTQDASTSFVNVGSISGADQARLKGIEVVDQHPALTSEDGQPLGSPWFAALGSFLPTSLLQTNEAEGVRHRIRAAGARSSLASSMDATARASVWDWLPPNDFETAQERSETTTAQPADEFPTTAAPDIRIVTKRQRVEHDSGKSALHAMSLAGLARTVAGRAPRSTSSTSKSLTKLLIEHTYRAQCVCDSEWIGFNCSQKYHSACSRLNHCSGHGVCATATTMDSQVATADGSSLSQGATSNGIRCECSQGWTGLDCSTPVKKHCAHLNSCSGHGECILDESSSEGRQYVCSCESNWIGQMCSQPRPKPCRGGCGGRQRGECVNGECLCRNGFTGRNCATSTCPNQCSGHGACDTTTEGSPLCLCQPEYTGVDCSRQQCPHACSGHGACAQKQILQPPLKEQDLVAGVRDTATTGSGSSTSSRQVFDGSTSGLSSGRALSTESTTWTDGDSSRARSARLSTSDSVSTQLACECYDGFFGAACQYQACNSSLCSGHGTCSLRAVAQMNSVFRVTAADQQLSIPDNYTLSPICACDSGFTGHRCEMRQCSKPCQNGGHCSTEGTCVCPTGFTGSACETKICPAGCNGRGTCDGISGECRCAPEFYGMSCELRKVPCRGWCSGHGTCNMQFGTCQCQQNFTGADCSLRRCPGDCTGNGVCDHQTGICHCHFNYAGQACERRTPLGEAKVALSCARACLSECQVADTSGLGYEKGSHLPGLDTAPMKAYGDAVNNSTVVACLKRCERDCIANRPTEHRQFPSYPSSSSTNSNGSLLVPVDRGDQMMRNGNFDASSNSWKGAPSDTGSSTSESTDSQWRPNSAPAEFVHNSSLPVSTSGVLHDAAVSQRAKDLLKAPMANGGARGAGSLAPALNDTLGLEPWNRSTSSDMSQSHFS